MSTEPKGTDPKVRDRISFQEVAKLATTPEPAADASEEKKENSGMINLAALAAGDTSPGVDPEKESKTEPSAVSHSKSDLDEGSPTSPGGDQLPTDPGGGPPHVERQGAPASVVRPILTIDIPATATPAPPAVSAPGLGNDLSKTPLPLGAGGASKLPPPPLVGIPPAFLRSATGAGSVGPRMPAPPAPPAEPSPASSTLPAIPSDTSRPSIPGKAKPAQGSWLTLSLGIVVGALVAAVFFRMGKADGVTPNAPAATPAEATVHSATPAIPSSHGASLSQGESRAVDPSSLPLAPAAETAPVQSAVPADPHPVGAVQGAPSAPTAPGPASPTPPQDHETAAPRADTAKAPPAVGAKQAAGGDQSLEALMKRAVGPSAAPPIVATPSPAATAETGGANAGNVPAKPAMGAVQGALGTVLPAARYCLGPDDPVSRATITFKSDGSVQSVTVTGDAAGQPAEGCIRSRLMTARVPPFASPSFTWTVTVRPAS